MTIANYLWASGRLPRITYIEYPGVWHRPSKEALVETIYAGHEPQKMCIRDSSHPWGLLLAQHCAA